MPGGRPTKYTPAMCDEVIALGAQGMSKAEMAAELGVWYSTFDLWQDKHEEFSEAVKQAVRQSQAWWEREGRKATFDAQGFSASSYIFQMKNRFRDDWCDRREIDNTSSDGSMTPQGLDVSKLSTEALKELVKAKDDFKPE